MFANRANISTLCVNKPTVLPLLALFASLLFTLFLAISPPASAQPSSFMKDEILVKMRPQTGVGVLQRIQGPGRLMKSLNAIRSLRIKLPLGMTLQQGLDAYRKLPGVEFVEPNHIMRLASTPNDVSYGQQYGPSITKANQAWDIWSPHGTTILAIIDTGVANTHLDLVNKILRDVNGIVGYNAAVTDPATGQLGARDDALDDYGHGTHVAGIAAAQANNTEGIAGIAGWDGVATHTDTSVKIMPVKVLTGGGGTDADVAGGIVWATDHGAKVINMSLGDTSTSNLLNDACQYAWTHGVVVVAAAGNNGSNAPFYPASLDNVLSVAASDNTDTLAGFSNWGARVNVAAPGVGVYSTLPNYNGTAFGSFYGTLSGTSMASPHVAGEAALIFSHNPNQIGRAHV